MKVLKFYAEWCGPCKMLSKVFEGAGDKITIPVEEIDIDKQMEVAQQYGIRGVPTMVVLDAEGKEVRRQSGYMNEHKLLDFLGVNE